MPKIARLEKDGNVAFTDGTNTKKVPSEAACRERLIKLLEEADGSMNHSGVHAFWRERAKLIGSVDPLEAAWARETFERLDKVWTELTTAPEPEDVFASFGV